MDNYDLAKYLVRFLRQRNGGQLDDAFSNMSVADHERLLAEMRLILKHRGKPPNWV